MKIQFLVLGCFLSCTDKNIGQRDGSCFANQTCDSSLECSQGKCIKPVTLVGGGDASGGGISAGGGTLAQGGSMASGGGLSLGGGNSSSGGGFSSCAPENHLCSNQCVSSSSVNTCGMLCAPCPFPVGGSPTCIAESCGFSCQAGLKACGTACATCSIVANSVSICEGNNCGFRCDSGFHVCSGACVSNTSTNSCGSTSCSVCPTTGNGLATCDGIACGLTCNAGFVRIGSSCISTTPGYFKASNTSAGDRFGFAVAMSSDASTLAIGAIQDASSATGINGDQTDNSALISGAVYVFTRSGNTWSQQAYIKASNTGADDRFGYSVALSFDGNTLAVGALYEASSASGINGNQSDNSASASGAVYVFARSTNTWSQQAYMKASNADVNDRFGTSVSLNSDGNTLAVGSRWESSSASGINGNQTDNSALYSGAVYVFTRTSSTWSQQAYIKASNSGDGDDFGYGVALSADGATLAVSAFGEASAATGVNGTQADNSSQGAGAAYVFTRSGGTWLQQAYLKASNSEGNDQFGRSIALSADGNTLALGATYEASSATGINGIQTDNSASNSGCVYIFIRSGNDWSQQAYVKASNTDANDNFGFSVSLSANGNNLAIGAYLESSAATGINGNESSNSAPQSGAIYFVNRSTNIWNQQVYMKAPNSEAYDFFGYSVSLSSDGNTFAIGAVQEFSSATGINGNQANNSAPQSGAVYVYSL